MGSNRPNLNTLLSAAKNNNKQQKVSQQQPANKRISEAITSTNIDSLDNMVFGAPNQVDQNLMFEQYQNGSSRKPYDPEEEMRAIKNGANYAQTQSHIPQAILESIIRNPLEMKPIEEQNQEFMTEGIQNRALEILDKLDANDRQNNNYVKQQPQPVVNEDYRIQTIQPVQQPTINLEHIAALVESIVDKKFKQYGNVLLNESRGPKQPKMAYMTLGDNFRFMDDNGNLYECELKYIGKAKIKNKQ